MLILIPQMIVLSLALFLMADAMPGDAIWGLAGPEASPEEVAALIEAHGLDGPWYQQYISWVSNIIRGDFGRSLFHGRPVVDIINIRIRNTMWLSLFSTIFTLVIAIPFGIIAARYVGKWQDRSILMYCFISSAVPAIALAILSIWIFALILNWFPMGGTVDVLISPAETFRILLSRLHHVMLPSLVLAVVGNFGTIYTLRAQIVDNSASAYVVTAKSKGVPTRTIYYKHIMRNSLIPFAQGLPFLIIGLVTGSIMIERIFSFHGMGDLFLSSIQVRDWPVVNAIAMFYGFLTIIGILSGDIILTLVDPRIKIK